MKVVDDTVYQNLRRWLHREDLNCSDDDPLIAKAVRESFAKPFQGLRPEPSESNFLRIDSNWVSPEEPGWLDNVAFETGFAAEDEDWAPSELWEGEEGDGRGRDVLAYYRSIHRFGDNWGIFFKLARMTRYARKFVDWANEEAKGLDLDLSLFRLELVRLVFAGVYHHEHFHYEVEMRALMAEIASAQAGRRVVAPRYLPYKREKYLPVLGKEPGADEEALANAQRCRKIGGQIVNSVREGSPPITVYLPMLHHRWMREVIPKEGPGYNRGWDLYRHGYHRCLRDFWVAVEGGAPIPKDSQPRWKRPAPPIYIVD
jgi:hypothetical protein